MNQKVVVCVWGIILGYCLTWVVFLIYSPLNTILTFLAIGICVALIVGAILFKDTIK